MTAIGDIATLKVARESKIGLFLDGGPLEDILLPKNELGHLKDIPEELEVFLYRDSEDRPIATLKRPRVLPGQIGILPVLSTSKIGAFLDWGLPKDLLLPFREQRGTPSKGSHLVVHVLKDNASDRLIASQRIEKSLGKEIPDFDIGQKVPLIIFGQTDMGYKAVVNGTHSGLLFANEVFDPPRYADQLDGYIKDVRPDRKIDLSLYPPGQEGIDHLEARIESELAKRNGFWAIDDSTPADDIHRELGVSKKQFKKATGALFRQRKITFADGGIRSTSAQ